MDKIMSGMGYLVIAMVVFLIFVYYTKGKQEQDRSLRERWNRETQKHNSNESPFGEPSVTITDSTLLNKIANIDPNSKTKDTGYTLPPPDTIIDILYDLPDTITAEDIMFDNEGLEDLLNMPIPGSEMEDYLNNPFKRNRNLLIEDSIK